jgi:hypothetical protein
VHHRTLPLLSEHPQIAADLRVWRGAQLLVVCNFSFETQRFEAPVAGRPESGWQLLLGNWPVDPAAALRPDRPAFALRPYAALCGPGLSGRQRLTAAHSAAHASSTAAGSSRCDAAQPCGRYPVGLAIALPPERVACALWAISAALACVNGGLNQRRFVRRFADLPMTGWCRQSRCLHLTVKPRTFNTRVQNHGVALQV